MADFQRVIEFLRDLRQGPLQSVNEEVTQMATEYAALCVQANDRLRRCSAFLQQGLRTEAIHLAEENPNLLDLVAALDLPDQQQWMEFCQNNGLAVPPPLQLDRAAQLNDAYSQDQPLEHLLSQHRLLALSRAPVSERLETLRKIAQLDAGNDAWQKDIRVFEKARIGELPHAFHQALKSRDEKAIAALMEEVNQRPWLEPIPDGLSAAVTDAFARLQRAGVETELRKLVPPLRDAFAARSLHECQALAQRWKNVMTTAGVKAVASELAEEIKPALAFITEQTKRDELARRFRDSCKAFARLLDEDAPDTQLEAGYAKLKEFHEPIPEELTQRYSAKRAGRLHNAERSHKMRLVAIGATALVVLGIGFSLAYLWTRSAAAQQQADRIRRALAVHTKEGLDNAQAYIAALQRDKPAMLAEPVVAAEVSSLETQKTQFGHDRDALTRWLSDASTARSAATSLAARPAPAMKDIAATVAALQSAIDAARGNGSFEWVDSDKQIAPALSDLQNALSGIQGLITTAARQELNNISSILEKIPPSSTNSDTIAGARIQIAALSDRAGALANLPGLDDATKKDVDALNTRLAERRAAMNSNLDVAAELEIIRRQTTSPDELKKGLQEFVTHFPNDALTPEFTRAMAHVPAAASMDAWHSVAAGFNGNFAPDSAATAQKRIDAVNAYLAANPNSPLASAANQYLVYLKQANEALADKGTWQNAFSDLISTPLLSELKYMQDSSGVQYFVLGDPDIHPFNMINGQFDVSFEKVDPQELTKRIKVTIKAPQTVSAEPIPAPHTKVVAGIAQSLKKINESNWDTYGIDLADQLVKNDQMELVVKVILLQQTLKTEQSVLEWTDSLGAGEALSNIYTKALADIARQSPAELPWIDPSKVPDATRMALKQCVDAVPASGVVKQKLSNAKNALFKSLKFDLLGIGVLLRNDQGWTVSSPLPPLSPTAQAALWTVTDSNPAGGAPGATAPVSASGQLVQIGKVVAGKYVVDENAANKVPQGSIVFITQP